MTGRRPFLLALLAFFGVAAFRFATRLAARRRGPRPAGFTDAEVATEMKARAQDAIEVAARDYGIRLDRSPGSVEQVEAILGRLHEAHRREPMTGRALTKEALRWGAYVGEVARGVAPYRWALNSTAGGEGSLPLIDATGGEKFPVRWCFKRISNGEEDNVWHKFSVLILKNEGAGGVTIGPDGESER